MNRVLGRSAVLLVLLTLFTSSIASAQYFGRNKVQWEKFDFKVLKTEHFDIYYYEDEEQVVEDVGRMAERWYTRLSKVFNHEFKRKPIVLYANSADFHQTTTTPGMIGEGTGGFTDEFQNRVVLPLTGNYAENDHVLGHELVHVFQYEMGASGVGNPGSRRFSLQNLPLWLIEGMAEYLSKGRIDPLTAMWVRDAANRDRLPNLRQITSDPRYFPYRYGQALLAYVGGRFGDSAVVDLFLAAGSSGLEWSFERALGVDHETLFNDWKAASVAHYAPITAGRTDSLGAPILGKKTTRGDLNIAPAISPDGRWIAFLSTRELFSIDLFLADASNGNIVGKLASSDTDPHYDAIRFIDSSGSWSPDSKYLAFVTYEKGDNRLLIIDVERRRTDRRIAIPGVPALSTPAWSPDGRSIAFSGQNDGVTDLYVYDLGTGAVTRLTNDKFADIHPTWSPDSKTIAFASDRSASSDLTNLRFDTLRIFTIDVANRGITQLPGFASGKHINPYYSPDGRSIYFIASPDGVSDVYRYSIDSSTITAMTHVATGVAGITELSPAMSVAQRTGEIALSVYERDNHNIYVLPSNTAGTTVATTLGTEVPRAAILPPARPSSNEVFTTYLQRPSEGLPPASVEYPSTGYDPKLRLTYLGPPTLGVGADRYGYGVGGTVSAYYSDVLGYHTVGFALQGGDSSNTSIENSFGGELFYLNQRNRINWGGRASHIPYISGFTDVQTRVDNINGVPTVVDVISLVRNIVTVDDIGGLAQYPLSATRRFETNAGYQLYNFSTEVEEHRYVNGNLLDMDTFELPGGDSFNLVRGAVAYVGDSSTFGFISPVRGSRYRYEVEALTGELNFQTALLDYRKYMYRRPMTLAVRGLHYGRYGTDAESNRFRPLFVGNGAQVRGYESDSFSIEECDRVSSEDRSCPAFDRLVGSRMALASAELRVPLFGVRELGLISGAFLPTELVLFADGGAAWSEDNEVDWTFETDTRARVPVFSAGVAVRLLLGYIPLQFYYAKPFQRPEHGWEFGFTIAPGW